MKSEVHIVDIFIVLLNIEHLTEGQWAIKIGTSD